MVITSSSPQSRRFLRQQQRARPPRNRHCLLPSSEGWGGALPPLIVRRRFERVLMGLFRQLFVWWENATPGTRMTTLFSGLAVGEDAFGNRYYQTKGGVRRWVIYSGTVEASRVPPDWHGWLHHTFENP